MRDELGGYYNQISPIFWTFRFEKEGVYRYIFEYYRYFTVKWSHTYRDGVDGFGHIQLFCSSVHVGVRGNTDTLACYPPFFFILFFLTYPHRRNSGYRRVSAQHDPRPYGGGGWIDPLKFGLHAINCAKVEVRHMINSISDNCISILSINFLK